jgi:SAM-dependent methyltransferase
MSEPAPETDHRKAVERDFFDAVYRDVPVLPANGFYDVSAGIVRYRELNFARCPGASVLELGCGTGAYAVSMAQKGARAVTAIDISPEAIKYAWQLVPDALRDRVTLQVGDVEALDFAPATFDLVCGTGILHHLSLSRALPEIRRVLAPGGQAIFYEPLGHNPALNLYRVLTPNGHTPDEHPLVMRDFARMREIFSDVSVEFFDMISLGAIPVLRTRLGRRLFHFLERMDAGLFALAPFVQPWASFAVVALTGGERSPRCRKRAAIGRDRFAMPAGRASHPRWQSLFPRTPRSRPCRGIADVPKPWSRSGRSSPTAPRPE